MPCHAMQCILYKIYFWKGFSYVLQIDMHFICTPMWTKFYSCKKWVLQCQSRSPRAPLLRHVVLRRVHSLTDSFPTRRIPRESTQSAPPIDTPNKVLPHTTPGHTHIGSWLYCFKGWSLHELVLRFGYDVYHRLPESTGQSPELSESTKRSSKPITPNLDSSH
jgi:hypothetical protein